MIFLTLTASAFLLCRFVQLSSDEHLQKRSVEPVNGTVYDYIVVGGGTSGLTVADRLTEDGTSESSPPQS